ncbi:MAG: F0F1 ATP synthase subunit alpha [Erysipelotrichaceae bacterium]|nr:F0F1 ATP synthase subunit alpha [Erysipelotrichaceae bacterium]
MSIDTRKNAALLYQTAENQNQTEKYFYVLNSLNERLNQDADLYQFIDNRQYSAIDKIQRVQCAFNNQLDNEVLSVFFLQCEAIDRSHIELVLLHDYLTYYYHLRDTSFGTIYSARLLPVDQIEKVEKAISKQIERNVKLENKIDESLLAGVKVVINNVVWDGSYKAKLKIIKENLINGDIDASVAVKEVSKTVKQQVQQFEKQRVSVETGEKTGYVSSVADGVVTIKGVADGLAGELVQIGNTNAMIMNLHENSIDAVLLDDSDTVVEGSSVVATGRVVEVPVGDEMLGRVVDALGRPIDDKGEIITSTKLPIEREAPGVIDRHSVDEPLETGIKIIDSMIPIGKGQRELIIGDRQTGKTAIAIDTILNQKGKNVKCIYVAIGQKNSTVAQIVEKLKQNDALEYTTIVVSGAGEPAALQYIAPYAGCAIGEYWRDKGEDVLIVYDDLSKHAIAYRTLSLLLRRPPGREAYPGDVFYLHSRLLERSAKLSKEKGSGSLTALPIVETLAGDISAYIPTNVISITDGQIFLQTDLFNSGVRPAVDSGFSVSRVGSSAQYKAMKQVSKALKLELAQYHEVLDFAQFGSDLDNATKETINHGQHLTELLKQKQYSPMSLSEMTIMLFANQKGFVDQIALNRVSEYEKGLLSNIKSFHGDVIEQIETNKSLSESLLSRLEEIIKEYTAQFVLE